MRVMVKEIEGGQAATMQAGQQVFDLVAPAIERGEPVVLDFDGVWFNAGMFFHCSIGWLMEKFPDDSVARLVSYENLPPRAQGNLEWAIEKALWRRANPEQAAAMDRNIRRKAAEDPDWME